MHSDRLEFHQGTKEYSKIQQTNTSNGSFHMANQALFSQKSLKALHRQRKNCKTLSVGSGFIFLAAGNPEERAVGIKGKRMNEGS